MLVAAVVVYFVVGIVLMLVTVTTAAEHENGDPRFVARAALINLFLWPVLVGTAAVVAVIGWHDGEETH